MYLKLMEKMKSNCTCAADLLDLLRSDWGEAYILILPPTNSRSLAFVGGGKEKKQWFVRLPRGVDEYTWGQGGEEGEEYGRSVKSENLSC